MSRANAITAVRNALTGISAIPAASQTVYEVLEFDDIFNPGLYINPSIVFEDDHRQLGGGMYVETAKQLSFSVTLSVAKADFSTTMPLLSMLTYYDAVAAAITAYMDVPANTDETGVVGMYVQDGEGGWAPGTELLHLTMTIRVLIA